MRDDEDNIRQYLPVLRRIIILVAVLTAIPVVMWTITVFVRSHVSPPQPPALQPMAIVPPSTANTTVATASDQPPPRTAETAQAAPSATTSDAGGGGAAAASAYAAPMGATPAFKTASVGGPPNPAKTDPMPAAAGPTGGAANPADGAAPQAPDSGPQAAGQPQESVWPAPPAPSPDAAPPGDAISGPVPLPRRRPTSFAVAGNIPLPAPRPDAAGGGAPAPAPTPIDWLKKVFHSSGAPGQPSETVSDTARE